MDDSHISDISNDELDVVFDENEDKNDHISGICQIKSYVSRPVMNFEATPSSSPYSSKSSRRSDSLSSSTRSLSSPPVSVSDIRNLSNSYQKLLVQATREIRKLNIDVINLEKEKERLLQANVDLALETKSLLLDQKAWKKEEEDLYHSNNKLATEVERLHKVEREQVKEIDNLQNQIKELLNQNHIRDQQNLKTKMDDDCLNTANGNSTQILAKVKSVEEHYFLPICFLIKLLILVTLPFGVFNNVVGLELLMNILD